MIKSFRSGRLASRRSELRRLWRGRQRRRGREVRSVGSLLRQRSAEDEGPTLDHVDLDEREGCRVIFKGQRNRPNWRDDALADRRASRELTSAPERSTRSEVEGGFAARDGRER